MGVQMNIKSEEAYALASELAEAEGISRTQVIVEALRARKRDREAEIERKVAKVMKLCEETRARLSPETLALDLNEFLYDEFGLPK